MKFIIYTVEDGGIGYKPAKLIYLLEQESVLTEKHGSLQKWKKWWNRHQRK